LLIDDVKSFVALFLCHWALI